MLTNREIVNELFSWNCEWLTRPNYTLSELADTLYANIATVSHYKDEVFTKNVVDLLVNKVQPVKVVLQRFNRKDSSVPKEPDEHDLAALMNFVNDSTLQSLPKEMYAAADYARLYSIAVYYQRRCGSRRRTWLVHMGHPYYH